MKAKKLFSALLAAAMAFGLLCAPASAAGKIDTLADIDEDNSIWVGVTNVDDLIKTQSFKLQGWSSKDGVITKDDGVQGPPPMRVCELPLGVTLAAGPNNNHLRNIWVYSDPDGDGIFVERIQKVTYDENDNPINSEMIPADATGPFTPADNETYYRTFNWGYGPNVVGANLVSSAGYHTATTDYLVELFGANTLMLFWDDEEEGYYPYLLTGEKAPAGVPYSLEDQGVYFSDFGDVVSGWAVEPVNAAGDAGLIDYRLEEVHKFDLTGNITRAEFARVSVDLYYAMSGAESVEDLSNPFTDVDEDTEFFTGILAAYKLGVVKGTSTEKMTFEPNKLVSRQELALMLSRVFEAVGGKIPAGASTTFADNGEISSWAMDAVAFMSAKGIINGVGSNRFDPKGNASVEQALKIAVEMLNKLDV